MIRVPCLILIAMTCGGCVPDIRADEPLSACVNTVPVLAHGSVTTLPTSRPAPFARLVGAKDREIQGGLFPHGLELEGCRRIKLVSLTITGGPTNLRLLNCQDVTIEDCDLSGAEGPADPDGHGIQTDKCRRVTIRNCRITRGPPSEDGINLYESVKVLVDRCTVVGKSRSPSGNGITIDRDSTGCTVRKCRIDVRGGQRCIVVAGGQQHLLDGNQCAGWTDKAIAVQACYESGVKNVVIRLRGLVDPADAWIDPKAIRVRVAK